MGLLLRTGLPMDVLRCRKPQSMMGHVIEIDHRGSI